MLSLIPYLPMDLRTALAARQVLPEESTGSALFADLSGFTALAEQLLHTLGSQRGAEEISHQLNQIYAALISQVHRYQGSVVSFAGDAILCWFADPAVDTAARRAVTCALALQNAMQLFPAIVLSDTTMALSLKVAVASGSIRRFQVGNPALHICDILAGTTLERVVAAEALARQGEVIIDPSTHSALAGNVVVTTELHDSQTQPGFACVRALTDPSTPCPWPSVSGLPPNEVMCRIPPAVSHWILNTPHKLVSDLRPATVLFLQFRGIDYDNNPDAGAQLDTLIQHIQQTLSHYDGTLLQVIMGEKGNMLYAAFGAPTIHEDDTRRAVQAALDMQSLPPNLPIPPFAIGLCQGTVHAGIYGSPTRWTYGILGDTVNLAARLMQHAPPGHVLANTAVYQATQTRYDWETLLPIRVKGKRSMVRVYRPHQSKSHVVDEYVTADSTRFDHQKHTTTLPLVGRDAEVEQLRCLLDTLQQGQGHTLIISGEAGSGKSCLSQTFIDLLRSRDLVALTGAGNSIEQQTPYHIWRDVMTSYFHLDTVPDPTVRQEQVRIQMAELAPHLSERLPLLNAVLELDFPPTPITNNLSPLLYSQNLATLLLDLLRLWMADSPLIVILEDVHWLDSRSWEVTHQIAQEIVDRQYPLLLVLISRPLAEYSATAAATLEHIHALTTTTTIYLDALPTAALAQIAANQLGVTDADVPPALISLIAAHAGGNPFFAEESVKMLQESGTITVAYDPQTRQPRYTLPDQITELEHTFPQTVQGVILARINRLPSEHQVLLKLAAVIGQTFNWNILDWLIQQQTDCETALVRDTLAALTELDLVLLENHEPEQRYRFKHVLIQQVVYQTLLYTQRRILHCHVASWYEQQQDNDLARYYPLLAHHYHYAEEPAQERYYTHQAGIQAATRYAHTEAICYLNRALHLTAESDHAERYAILRVREQVYDLQAARENQVQDLAALTNLTVILNDTQRQAEVALRWAHYAYATSDFPQSIQHAQQVVTLARQNHYIDLEIEGYLAWGQGAWCQGANDVAYMHFTCARDLAQSHGAQMLMATSLRFLGILAYEQGHYASAWSYYEQILPIYRKLNNRTDEGNTLCNLGVLAQQLGNVTQARAYYEQHLQICREIGDQMGEAIALHNLGDISMHAQNYPDAITYMEQSLHLCRKVGHQRGTAMALHRLGAIALQQGDMLHAHHVLHQAWPMCQALGIRTEESITLALLALLAHYQGQQEQAYHYSAQALYLAEQSDQDAYATALLYTGYALEGLQRVAEAVTFYQRAYNLRCEQAQWHLTISPLAGLARMALAQQQQSLAQDYVDEILTYLERSGVRGIEAPIRVYLTCYQVLDTMHDSRAGQILHTGYTLLQAQATQFVTTEQRRRFLEVIPAHRELLHACATYIRGTAIVLPDDYRCTST